MYVVTTKRQYKGKTYTNYLIQQSYREEGKVKHKTLSNITHLPADLIEVIRRRLKEGRPLAAPGFSIKRSLPHGHVATILKTMRDIGLDSVIASKPGRNRDIIIGLIVQRLIRPGSKLDGYRGFRSESATTSVGKELNLEAISHNQVYQAMDWLLESQPRIEKKLARKHLKEGTILLYDLSGSYYTGQTSDLVQYGYNRDGKKGYPQIVYGLLCDSEGCPVAVEVFSGNTPDSETMPEQIEKVRQRFGIKQVVWVGDRGMITGKFISEELSGHEGLDWITALRGGQVRKLVNQQAIQLSLFDKQDMVEIESKDYAGERLVVCKNPLLAEERSRNRQQLLEATRKELDKIVAATQRKHKPLRGKDAIGVKVGKVIDKYKMGKHINYSIEKASFTYQIDTTSVAEEEMLDGLYVIRTSLPQSSYSPEQTVETYKSLSHVEWAFRTIKTTLLQIRPIYHWDDKRIRSHVFLCMLAYYVQWHLHRRLAPLLYADDQKQQARQKRRSVVAPAQKSNDALQKAATHLTEEGNPVHSIESLINFLGTICKNEMQYEGHQETFSAITEPINEQQQILDLLNVKL
jgi:transposase